MPNYLLIAHVEMTTNNSVENFAVLRCCNFASALLKPISRRRRGPIRRPRGQLILSHRHPCGGLLTPSLRNIAVQNAIVSGIV